MVGVADARDDVPVVSASDRQGCPGRRDMQPSLGVESIGKAEQVVLVGAAAVVEDEQAGGVARRRSLAVLEGAQQATPAPAYGERSVERQ